ncbi:MAG: ankyrin repeat domain-containing protein [Planctomycetaceae bacterium]|nr:ankyrin repeat domain-containing protein [Planctomycetaceae bacterium]
MFCFPKLAVLGMVLMMAGCGASAGGVNIWDAVEHGDAEAVKTFALADGDLNVRNMNGDTPLWVALTEKNRESYEALLKYGADPNVIMSGKRVVTHWAATKDDPWWLRMALEYGADPNLVNTGSGRPSEGPPLKFAISGVDSRLDNVRLLVEHGADVEKKDLYNCYPLSMAAAQTKFDIVLYLLESGADYHQAECGTKPFLERMRLLVENRNRWFRLEEDRKALDVVRVWLEEHGEDLGEPLPAE